jgi:outer membrane protein assembly factor BamB
MTRQTQTLVALAAVLLLLGCPKKNHAPDAPSVPVGPSVVPKDSTARFSSRATDPDGDSVCIRFDWGDSTTSAWSNWVASGETSTMSHAWSSANTYHVRTQAKDRPGSTSDWSLTVAVKVIADRPPDAPAIPSGPSTAPKDSTCLFTTIASDPDGDSVCYRFDWGEGDTSNWSSWVRSGQPRGAHHAWHRSGAISVRAQSKDIREALSLWSNPHSIAVRNRAPNMPSVPSGPAEGDRCVSYGFSSSATDPDSDSVAIRFDWGNGDTSDWSTLVPSGLAVAASHAWANPGTYPVRTQAKDKEGDVSGWAEPWKFTVVRLRWRYHTGDSVESSPAVAADGTVYVGSDDSYLYAINPDGSLRWRYRTGDMVKSSPAVAADGTVYAASCDGYLYAVNPDGTFKWRHPNGRYQCSSPAIAADGTVYVGSDDSYLYAINPDGSLKWQLDVLAHPFSSPAIGADGTVYVGSYAHYLYAINPDSSLKWQYQTSSSRIASSPATGADGTIYFGGGIDPWDLCLYAINPDGSLKWRYATDGGICNSPVIAADGTVYVSTTHYDLYAINPDGSLKWRHGYAGGGYSSPAVGADGTVYVWQYNGLYAVSPDGSPEWHYDVTGSFRSSPAIAADGTVYVGSFDSYLYAFWGDGPLANSPWPKFHHDNRNTGRAGGGRQ